MKGDSSKASSGDRVIRCPICLRETHWEGNPYRPFCSERCKLVDLGKWMLEEYRIPEDIPEGEEPR